MPSKRGRGWGRRAPPDKQGKDTFHGQQRFQRDRGEHVQPQSGTPPTGFFATSSPSADAAHDEPTLSAVVPKRKIKTRTVHPEELGIELNQDPPIRDALPRRPGVGNLGKPIKLISNCFPIEIPSGYVYHYDVEIFEKEVNFESEATTKLEGKRYRCLRTKTSRKIISQMLENNAEFNDVYAAYDGKRNLFTRKELEANFPLICKVHFYNDEFSASASDFHGSRRTYEVEIKPVKKKTGSCAINLDTIHALFENRTTTIPQEAVMAVETILRHGPCLRFTPVGRSFYYPPNIGDLHPLGGGLEIWFGYHQSVRLGQWSPTVNLDVSATTFLKEGPVLNYIAQFMNKSVDDLRRIPHIPAETIKRLNLKLKNKQIVVTHLSYPRKHSILELTRENANRVNFTVTDADGNEESVAVATYFRNHHGRDLEFSNLPCLRVSPKNKTVYYPIEVCNFTPGQHAKTELTLSQKTEMIKFTCISPRPRFREIDDILQQKADFDNDRCMQEFDLQVSPEPLSLEGRVLESPTLIYKDVNAHEKKIRPKNGSWDLRRTQFLHGAEISQWVLLSFEAIDDRYLDEFSRFFLRIGRNLGITIGRPSEIRKVKKNCDVEKLLLNVKQNAELAVVVLPAIMESEIYSKVKKASETVAGLITQCVKESNIRRRINEKSGPQFVSNLWLKVNAKMGGVNNILVDHEIPVILKDPIIIIGADVNHPPPSSRKVPSLAACVGSLTMNLSKCAVSIRPQFHEVEKKKAEDIILYLKEMVEELLLAFYRHTNTHKPQKIIFYRDGVSEGQFETVRKREVRSIRKACRSLEKGYEPGITFIIVQKRHHVRFMPGDPRDGKNIPPGTIVDTAVTHPVNFDYFLCSQYGLKGTSRPSHYTVVEDDNKFTVDDIQKITFQLCHMSVRCTRSISVPAPVAYADRVAYRARKYLEAEIGTEEDWSSDDGTSRTIMSLLREAAEAVKILDEFKCSMYFV